MSPISYDRGMNQALSWHVSVLPLSYGNNTDFFSNFSADGLHGWAFYWLFLWNFKGSVMAYGCFISTVRRTIRPFFQFSPWRDPRLRHFAGYPFRASRKKHQPFSTTQPFQKTSTSSYDTAIKERGLLSNMDTLKKHSAKKGFAFLQ